MAALKRKMVQHRISSPSLPSHTPGMADTFEPLSDFLNYRLYQDSHLPIPGLSKNLPSFLSPGCHWILAAFCQTKDIDPTKWSISLLLLLRLQLTRHRSYRPYYRCAVLLLFSWIWTIWKNWSFIVLVPCTMPLMRNCKPNCVSSKKPKRTGMQPLSPNIKCGKNMSF